MNNKDWTGNKPAIFVCNGASNHSEFEREKDDYYATDPVSIPLLLEQETFSETVWENAVGGGHLAGELKKAGYNVFCSDIVDRGYPGTEIIDFLKFKGTFDGDIITNPPYKYALEFCEKGLEVISEGHKMAMFLKLTFLEGQKRKKFFLENPPKTVYVFSGRVDCSRNGDFANFNSKAVAYCWFVWEKGYKGDPHIKWIN